MLPACEAVSMYLQTPADGASDFHTDETPI